SSKKRKIQQPEIEVDVSLPEPPSKKAKRALKKGKVLPPKPDSDDERRAAKKAKKARAAAKKNGDAAGDGEGSDASGDDDQEAAAAEATPAKKQRSPYGVWIGNLRFTVTRDELRRWLVDNSGGSITSEAITRVHIPSSKLKGKRGADASADTNSTEKKDFENKGFAYVDFATYEATIAAIALSETEWYRRKLLIKDATSFEGRPEEHKNRKPGESVASGEGQDGVAKKTDADQPSGTSAAAQSRKIFVGNMSFQTTEDDVHELFSKCGEIEWVKVATFEDSGKCKGYGWVKFKEPIATEWAVKGFVKIKEVEETEEDFMDVDENEEEAEDEENSSSSDESAKKTKPVPAPEKKIKMRKWWVNTLHGRRLKIEHAEDDQTRYKKRFGGRGAPQNADRSGPRSFNNRGGGGGAREFKSFGTDINVARLTGAAVKPEGKKITFE
ncbi:hypothetical protein BD289DRAFT_346730, partial [Coniella lustricola]